MVYWQGLDSLAAVFLSLSFDDDAVAWESFRRFVRKWGRRFFVDDNSGVIQEWVFFRCFRA
jgi:hypothetical protein